MKLASSCAIYIIIHKALSNLDFLKYNNLPRYKQIDCNICNMASSLLCHITYLLHNMMHQQGRDMCSLLGEESDLTFLKKTTHMAIQMIALHLSIPLLFHSQQSHLSCIQKKRWPLLAWHTEFDPANCQYPLLQLENWGDKSHCCAVQIRPLNYFIVKLQQDIPWSSC